MELRVYLKLTLANTYNISLWILAEMTTAELLQLFNKLKSI